MRRIKQIRDLIAREIDDIKFKQGRLSRMDLLVVRDAFETGVKHLNQALNTIEAAEKKFKEVNLRHPALLQQSEWNRTEVNLQRL